MVHLAIHILVIISIISKLLIDTDQIRHVYQIRIAFDLVMTSDTRTGIIRQHSSGSMKAFTALVQNKI